MSEFFLAPSLFEVPPWLVFTESHLRSHTNNVPHLKGAPTLENLSWRKTSKKCTEMLWNSISWADMNSKAPINCVLWAPSSCGSRWKARWGSSKWIFHCGLLNHHNSMGATGKSPRSSFGVNQPLQTTLQHFPPGLMSKHKPVLTPQCKILCHSCALGESFPFFNFFFFFPICGTCLFPSLQRLDLVWARIRLGREGGWAARDPWMVWASEQSTEAFLTFISLCPSSPRG